MRLRGHEPYRVYAIENPAVETPSEPLDVADIRNSLKALMWRDLRGAEARIDSRKLWRRLINGEGMCWPGNLRIAAAGNCKTCLRSRIMIQSVSRRKIRGVHLRTDYPQTDDARFRQRICLTGERLSTIEVPPS